VLPWHFANVIKEGPVGIVSAAGTGLQEVSTLLAKNGVGITQGIGTGGRDLKKDVGGIMFLDGLKLCRKTPPRA
jgi:succinyl-CoA synthetase alpha subunit